MGKASKSRLFKDVKFLTELRPYRNHKNLASLEKAGDYIDREFKSAGLLTSYQKWLASGKEYKNVIASYNENKTRRLIVGAHYDVYGDQPGADDNASAVAGLLETARLIADMKPQLDYRIDFVAYCLEEPPYFGSPQMGSYIHAQSLYDKEVDVIGMLCYEMIGYFSDEPESQAFPSPELAKIYPHTGNFIIVVGIDKYRDFSEKVHSLMSKNASIDVQKISFPNPEGLAGLSDHRNYWKFGYNALMINDTSFIRNPNYHTASDSIDTLDFDRIVAVVNCCYNAVTGDW